MALQNDAAKNSSWRSTTLITPRFGGSLVTIISVKIMYRGHLSSDLKPSIIWASKAIIADTAALEKEENILFLTT
jgi:hypothetical protein